MNSGCLKGIGRSIEEPSTGCLIEVVEVETRQLSTDVIRGNKVLLPSTVNLYLFCCVFCLKERSCHCFYWIVVAVASVEMDYSSS